MSNLPQDPIARLNGEVARLRQESARLEKELAEASEQAEEARERVLSGHGASPVSERISPVTQS